MYLIQEINNDFNKVVYIIIGSIIGSAITYYFNYILQKRNYKNEYYKQVIARRLDAYYLLETMLQLLIPKQPTNENKNVIFHKLFTSREKFDEFYNTYGKVAMVSSWFNNNLYYEFISFNTYLNEIQNEIKKSNDMIELIGYNHFGKLCEHHYRLQKLYFEDMRSLYKIENFWEDYDERSISVKKIY